MAPYYILMEPKRLGFSSRKCSPICQIHLRCWEVIRSFTEGIASDLVEAVETICWDQESWLETAFWTSVRRSYNAPADFYERRTRYPSGDPGRNSRTALFAGQWMYLYRAIDSVGDTASSSSANIAICRPRSSSFRKALTRHGRPIASSSTAVKLTRRQSFPATRQTLAGSVPAQTEENLDQEKSILKNRIEQVTDKSSAACARCSASIGGHRPYHTLRHRRCANDRRGIPSIRVHPWLNNLQSWSHD